MLLSFKAKIFFRTFSLICKNARKTGKKPLTGITETNRNYHGNHRFSLISVTQALPGEEGGDGSVTQALPGEEGGDGSVTQALPGEEGGDGSVTPTEPDKEGGDGSVTPTVPGEEGGDGSVTPTEPDKEGGDGSVAPTKPDGDGESSVTQTLPDEDGNGTDADTANTETETTPAADTTSAEGYLPYEGASYRLTCKELTDGSLSITGYTGEAKGQLVIPEVIGGKKVTEISDFAFGGCSGFTGTLTIPGSVTAIGSSAFSGCSGLEGLILPENLSKISNSAFEGCTSLKGELKLPEKLSRIGSNAFKGCQFTGELKLPDTLAHIEEAVFSGCKFSGDLRLPEALTYMSASAFDNAGSFTNLDLRNYPRSNNGYTGKDGIFSLRTFFYNCTFTGNLVMPAEMLYISSDFCESFSGFTGTLTLPQKVTRIGSNAFSDCHFKGNLVIPEGTTSISQYAFSDCDFDGTLTLPQSLTEIGDGAFRGCHFTGTLTLPQGLTKIGERAFAKGWGTDDVSPFTGDLVIPEGITSISSSAFNRCGFDGTLTLPQSLTRIGESAFENCKFTGALTLPQALTEIEGGAFYNCGFTGALTLPQEITRIGSSAFANCSFTGPLELPVNLKKIESSAFSGCGFTGNLILPEGLTELNGSAFAGLDGLSRTVEIPASLSSLPDKIFIDAQLYPVHTIKPIKEIYFTGTEEQWKKISANVDKREITQDTNIHYGQHCPGYSSGWEETPDGWKYRKEANGSVSYPASCWLILGGNRYWMDENGYRTTGLAEVRGKHYCFTPEGIMVTGQYELDGATYYFKEDGTALTGWQQKDDARYYFDPDGKMHTGWAWLPIYEKESLFLPVGETYVFQFYFMPDGKMATGKKTIDGKSVYFLQKDDLRKEYPGYGDCMAAGVATVTPANHPNFHIYYEKSADGSSVSILGKSGEGSGGSLSLPDEISGLPVTSVDLPMGPHFSGNLRLPAHLKHLGNLSRETHNGEIYSRGIGDLVVPDGVTSIDGELMYSDMTSIFIPASVKDITVSGLAEHDRDQKITSKLRAINIDPENQNYASHEGVLYTKGFKKLLLYPCGKKDSVYQIPEATEEICTAAFEETLVSRVILPSHLKKINSWAFSLSSITSMEIPGSVTEIGSSAFDCCLKLKKLVIQEGVTTIRPSVFRACVNLDTIVFPKSIRNISSAFFNSSNWKVPNLYYAGSKQDWINNVDVSVTEDSFLHVERMHFNCTEGWKSDAKGSWYQFPDGTRKTGWLTQNGNRYYLQPGSGYRATGLVTIQGEQYYFDANGIMQTGKQNIGGKDRWFREDGTLITEGFQQDKKGLWYRQPDGSRAGAGWLELPEGKYYLDKDGYVLTGLQTIGEGDDAPQYYFNEKGQMLKNSWQTVDGSRRYFKDNGAMARNERVTIDGTEHGFNKDGEEVIVGWHKDDRGQRYMDYTGEFLKDRWLELQEGKYYLDKDGYAVTGLYQMQEGEPEGEQKVNTYFFSANGQMLKGWQTIAEKRHYFDPETGIMACDEVLIISGTRYGFDENGVLIPAGWKSNSFGKRYLDYDGKYKTGWYTEGSKTYYFDNEGYAVTGLMKLPRPAAEDAAVNAEESPAEEAFYFFASDYTMRTGWQTIDGKRYYFDPADRGAMVQKKVITIGSTEYGFDEDGVLVPAGWKSENGHRRYLDCDGSYLAGSWLTEINRQFVPGFDPAGYRHYYFDTEGNMVTGLQELSVPGDESSAAFYLFASDGYMRTGWQTISGKKHYFYPDESCGEGKKGCMAKGCTVKIGSTLYGFDKDGALFPAGWRSDYGGKRYLYLDGAFLTENWLSYVDRNYTMGFAESSPYRYYFDAEGYAVTGLVTLPVPGAEDDATANYLFASDGKLRTGWQTIDGKRYYFDPRTGAMVQNTVITIGSSTTLYGFDENGVLVPSGWKTVNGHRCYLYCDGEHIKNTWATERSNHQLVPGWEEKGYRYYYFDENGYALTGLVKVPKHTADNSAAIAEEESQNNEAFFFFASDGYMRTGWQTISGKKHYFYPDDTNGAGTKGSMATGYPVKIGSTRYGFDKDGVLVPSGWRSDYGGRRYLYLDGQFVTNSWLTEIDHQFVKGFDPAGYRHYYFDGEGYAVTGLQEIAVLGEEENASASYYFSSDGYMHTGWQTIDGKKYYFYPDETNGTGTKGRMAKGCRLMIGSTEYGFDENGVMIPAGWKTENGRRRYLGTDGEYLKNQWLETSGKRYRYYFDNAGFMVTGLQKVQDDTYYFSPSYGYILKGWYTVDGVRRYFDADGKMVTGDYTIGSTLYHFNADGELIQPGWKTSKEGRWYMDKTGERHKGWLSLSDGRYLYYFNDDGFMVTGLQELPPPDAGAEAAAADGAEGLSRSTYYLSPSNGYMLKGWYTIDGVRRYFGADGKMVTGDYTIGSTLYHFTEDGELIQPGWKTSKEGRWYMDESGKHHKGWLSLSDGRYLYYFNDDGFMVTGLQELPPPDAGAEAADGTEALSRSTYYLSPSSGYMLKGWYTVDGVRRYFGEDGKMAAGQQHISGKDYLFTKDGELIQKGWKTSKEGRWYMDENGERHKGWLSLSDGRYRYYLDNKTGFMQTGLQEIEGSTYYFSPSYGYLLTGWHTIGGKKYYFDTKTGTMVQNAVITIGSSTTLYGFDENGVLVPSGWKTENGHRRYLYCDGNYITGWATERSNHQLVPGTEAKGYHYYYFDGSGNMVTGKRVIGEKTYYFYSGGYLRTGWQTIDGKKYYFYPDDTHGEGTMGSMAKDCRFMIGSTEYGFDKNGVMVPAGWKTENGHRRYLYCDGNYITGWATERSNHQLVPGVQEKGYHYYYFDENGFRLNGLQEIGGKTYYFSTSYSYMLTGWRTLGGKRYYFDAANGGAMVRGQAITISNVLYGFDKDGVLIPSGWRSDYGGKRYFGFDGEFVKNGWLTEVDRHIVPGFDPRGSRHYYFDSEGYAVTGLQNLAVPNAGDGSSAVYYFSSDGSMRTGWQTIDGNKYYFYPDETNGKKGCMAAGCTVQIGSAEYGFTGAGVLISSGWKTENGKRRYLKTDGEYATGWLTEVNRLLVPGFDPAGPRNYYFDGEGYAVTGLQKLAVPGADDGSEAVYYFSTSGQMLKGWYTIDGVRRYFGADGKMVKNDYTIGKTTYHFNADGELIQKGWKTSKAGRWYMDAEGNHVKGWFDLSEGRYRYYFDETTGFMVTGLQKLSDGTYYFSTSGYMLKGWYTVDGVRRYFGADGKMVTGEQKIGGKDYRFTADGELIQTGWKTSKEGRWYMDEDGKHVKGWLDLSNGRYRYYLDEETGFMVTGLQEVEDSTYYFSTSGQMLKGWYTVDGVRRYFDADGKMVTGEQKIGRTTYHFTASGELIQEGWKTSKEGRWYMDADGNHVKGWLSLSGGRYRYYLGEDGFMVKGLQEIEGSTYYFSPSYGYMLTGWHTIGGRRYYFYPADVPDTDKKQGCMAKDCILKIGSIEYGFGDSGVLISSGWKNVNGHRRYLKTDGTFITGGWLTEVSRHPVPGFDPAGSRHYYFDTNGNMVTGKRVIGEKTYYFSSDGSMRTGWQTIDSKKYYFYPDETNGAGTKGCMATGSPVQIGSTRYGFGPDGVLVSSGWKTENGHRRYLGLDGEYLTKEWLETSGGRYHYYFDENGFMVKGLQEIGGETYYFSTYYGYLLTGWRTLGGKRYYFDAANGGAMAKDCQIMIGRTLYGFDKEGVLVPSGFKTVGGHRRYLKPDNTYATGWLALSSTEKYYFNKLGNVVTGKRFIDGETYYFSSSGYMRTGWQTIDGKRYYFDPLYDGAMAWGRTVTIGSTGYGFDDNGVLIPSGWKTVNGGKKYLGLDGAYLTNQWLSLSGGRYRYYFDENGFRVKGLQTIGTDTYYFSSYYGYMLKGWYTIDGVRRYFDEEGRMVSNDYTIGRTTYHFNAEGELIQKGWKTSKAGRWYMDEDGFRHIGWLDLSGKRYYLDENGFMVKGLQDTGDGIYYFSPSYGYMLKGWYTVDGVRRYFDADGRMVSGDYTIGRTTYHFNMDGELIQKGWKTSKAGRWYMDENGEHHKGWLSLSEGRYRYYFDDAGFMVKGLQKIDGNTYYFSTSGYMLKGWYTIGGKRHYFYPDAAAEHPAGAMAKDCRIMIGSTEYGFDADGVLIPSGWKTEKGHRRYLKTDGTYITDAWFLSSVTHKYYFDDNGFMVKGLRQIGGETYFFDANGLMKTGWQTIDGKKHYFDSKNNGAMVHGKTIMIGTFQYGFDENGVLVPDGWKTDKGGKRFLHRDGKYARNEWVGFGKDKEYYFNDSGYAVTGLRELPVRGASEGTAFYFFNSDGLMQRGWQTINGKRMYFDPETGKLDTSISLSA